MNKYGIRLTAHMSTYVEIEAESQEEAIDIASNQYTNGELMGDDIQKSDYYDGFEIDIEEVSQEKSIKCACCKEDIYIGDSMYSIGGDYVCSTDCIFNMTGISETVLEDCFFDNNEE